MAIIYQHLKPCGEVFYIGIGKNIKRAFSKNNRNKYWHNIVNKHNYEIQILKQDLTWEDAKELEVVLISWCGRKDLKTGTLVNMTDGGEGMLNCIMSEKTLKLKSKIMTGKMLGNKNPMFGKKGSNHPAFGYIHSEKDKNKKKENYVKENHHFYGKKLTLEHKNKIRNSTLGKFVSQETIEKKKINHPSKKPDYVPPTLGKSLIKRILLNIETGIFYTTVKEACYIYNIKQSTLTAMLNGRNPNKTSLIYC